MLYKEDLILEKKIIRFTNPYIKGDKGGYYWPEYNEKDQLVWQASEEGMPYVPPFDVKGDDGGYYTPFIDEAGELNWVPSNEKMPAVLGASLATKEYVDEAVKDVEVDVDLDEYALKTDIPDVSNFATKDEIPNLDGYAKTADIPDVSGLATKAEIPSLEGYAKTTDIPDTSGLATKEEIPDVSGYTTMSAVEAKGYQTEEEVRAIVAEGGGGSGSGGGDYEVFTPAVKEGTQFIEVSTGLSPQGSFVQDFIDKYSLEYDTTYYLCAPLQYSGTVYLGTTPTGGEISKYDMSYSPPNITYNYGSNCGVTCSNFYNVAGNYIAFQIVSAKPGVSGLVPAPQIGDESRILKGDGTWGSLPVTMDTKFNILANDTTSHTFNAPYAKYGFIEGYNNTLISAYNDVDCNHIEGSSNKVESVQGSNGIAGYNHIEGLSNTIRGGKSHIDGQNNTIGHSAECATISGRGNTIPNGVRQQNPQTGIYQTIVGSYAHLSGYANTTTGECSSVEGKSNNAYVPAQHVQGKYSINDVEGLYADIIGNGTANSDTDRANAYTLDWSGNATFAGTVTSSGADYAEYFEWLDGNPEEEDRVGYIVKLNGNKIEFANADDDILGIISGTMTVLGDNAEWYWQGKYLTDDFGRVIYEDKAEWGTFINPETQEEEKCIIGVFPAPKLNPNYDADMPYENRKVRPEWDAVGMMGKLYVRDDGTAQVNGYVTANNGIATASGTRTNMRVMERVSENIIRVCLK